MKRENALSSICSPGTDNAAESVKEVDCIYYALIPVFFQAIRRWSTKTASDIRARSSKGLVFQLRSRSYRRAFLAYRGQPRDVPKKKNNSSKILPNGKAHASMALTL